MLVPGSANPLLLRSAAAAGGYSISRSLRFNSSDSAYLSRTPGSAGNRRTWTWAGWVKASAAYGAMFAGGSDGSNISVIYYGADGRIWYYDYIGAVFTTKVETAAVFRDFSAWFHLAVAVDTTQATSSNRVKLYINGSQVTAFSTATYPSLNADTQINTTTVHTVGRESNWYSNYSNFYLADIHFIDGQALDPSSFTEVSATTGQLIPKAYTGSFGTNGFWLKFSDNSAATATTLGKDYSGNGNNWTPNNFSVAAGAGNDSLVDTPTSGSQVDTGLGGQVTGNYCTLNPLKGGSPTNGNLEQQNSSPINFGTIGVSSGKWYFETVITTQTGGGVKIGVAQQSATGELGDTATGWAILGQSNIDNGKAVNNGSLTSSYTTFAQGDVVSCAFDVDGGKIWWAKNGTWLNSGNPSAGTNAIYSNLSGTLFPAATANQGGYLTHNFGQRAFAYTAPSGFKALCDTNLTAPVVAKPSTVMDVALYTGTGSALTATSALAFSPDFVWIKGRSGATDHALYDAVRGATIDLVSNSTAAETTQTQGLTAFNSNGFSVGTLAKVNTSSATYAAWCWDAGSSTVTNTQGSITSQVRANASAGFSIVSYTGTGTSPVSVGHGLNIAPTFLIFKNRDDAVNWQVWTTAISSSGTILEGLNTTAAGTTPWTYISTTSSLIQFNSGNSAQTTNGKKFICYAFSPVAGYSSMGSYVGNGSADGPFIYTGFRPKFILVKNTSVAGAWEIYDSVRNPYNVMALTLLPNASDAEITASNGVRIDFTSNGFKWRDSGSSINGSGNTIIWAAFAESPLQYSRAR